MRGKAAFAGALAAAIMLWLPAPSMAGRGLTTGFADDLFQSGTSDERELYLGRAGEANAGLIKFFVRWDSVSPEKPNDATDPADPAYDFSRIDEAVRGASSHGFEVLLAAVNVPAWAEGKNRPKRVPRGTWKPRRRAFADFSEALALRYSGSFGDLPRVALFQPLNEPNLSTFLNPQWKGRKLVSPALYRGLLNAMHGAIKSVDPRNRVVSAGLAPYGDEPGGDRSRPLRFWRAMLCLDVRLKQACNARTKLDIFGEHAINTSGGPNKSAVNKDDFSTGDLPEGRRILRAAESAGTVSGGDRHPIWVTEFWWESDPPDAAQGVPLKVQARNIAETIQLAWKAGASAAIGLQIRDSVFTRKTRFARSSTGIYFSNDRPKPSARAFAFPFVAGRLNDGRVRIWGRAPAGERVIVEQMVGESWKEIKTPRVGAGGVFTGTVRIAGRPLLRARSGGDRSLDYRAK